MPIEDEDEFSGHRDFSDGVGEALDKGLAGTPVGGTHPLLGTAKRLDGPRHKRPADVEGLEYAPGVTGLHLVETRHRFHEDGKVGGVAHWVAADVSHGGSPGLAPRFQEGGDDADQARIDVVGVVDARAWQA